MSKIGLNNEYNRNVWLKSVLLKIPKGKKILDAGAGEQQFKKYCSHLKYFSQDFGKYNGVGNNVALQTKKWSYGKLDIVSDITEIPLKKSSFDVVLCTEVFEHIIDPLKALKEFSRITKKGGYLVLTAPFCSLTHFAPYHFYTGFSKYFYENALNSSGYEILEIKSNGNYFEYLAQEVRRLPSVTSEYSQWQNLRLLYYLNILYLFLLEKINQRSKRSEELLCFGYHVFARKK